MALLCDLGVNLRDFLCDILNIVENEPMNKIDLMVRYDSRGIKIFRNP